MNFFPWLVRVQNLRLDGRISNCGGSMITKQHLITASHCIQDNSTSISVIVNGYEYLADRVFKAESSEVIDQFLIFEDMSILKLRQVPMGCIIPICLPQNTTENLMVNGNLTLASFQGGMLINYIQLSPESSVRL